MTKGDPFARGTRRPTYTRDVIGAVSLRAVPPRRATCYAALMRSVARRRQWFANIRPFIPRPTYVSIEACDRLDVPALLAASPPTDREKLTRFAVRVVDGQRFLLRRKERWSGARFWFLSCPNPSCRRAFAGRGIEYVLRVPGGSAWACRHCLPVTWASRRYRRSSPSRAERTPLHRKAVQLARERRKRERETRRVDRILAPVVRDQRQGHTDAEARKRRQNTELATEVFRSVAEHGAVEVTLPQRPRLSVAQLQAMVRAARRRALAAKRVGVS